MEVSLPGPSQPTRRVVAVIPARDEEATVGVVVAGALHEVDEVIVVDDGSDDGTGAAAGSAGATVLRLQPARGYLAAVRRGVAAAGDATVIVTLDADGEHPPEAIPRLVAPILAGGADMVQGARTRVPRPSERVLTGLVRLVATLGDTGTGFRAIRGDLARKLTWPGRCLCGTLALEAASLGARIVDVPVPEIRADAPRRVAWFHALQLGHVLAAMARYRRRQGR